jgi:hypothetical protein
MILEKFGQPKVLLPVIHVENLDQAMSNLNIAEAAGVKGVWLINHSVNSGTLLEITGKVQKEYPKMWIGVNCLDKTPVQLFGFLSGYGIDVDGVWVDNARIDELSNDQLEADKIAKVRNDSMYFGGVAFKYQREVKDLESAVKIAKNYVDVITTSGDGTGQAASVEKVKRMFEAADGHPLAIASGITPNNVNNYLPYIDVFLVSTGISDNFNTLNLFNTWDLNDTINNYKSE